MSIATVPFGVPSGASSRLLRGAARFAFAALVASSACRQVVGIDDRSPDTGLPAVPDSASACGTLSLPSNCQTCSQTQCCTETRACGESETCRRYEECLGRCAGDPPCRSTCLIETKWTTDEATRQFDVCLAKHCSEACALSCGAQSYAAEPAVATKCENCFVAAACVAAKNCAVDPDCQRAIWCHFGCRNYDCSEACDDPALASTARWLELTSQLEACSQDCNFGGYWACAGTVGYSTAKSDKVHLTGKLYDYTDKRGFAGVTVTACGETDVGCTASPKLATTTTDDKGGYVLDIPTRGIGSPGFSGYLQLTGGGIMDLLVYFPPLTYPNFPTDLPALTLDEFKAFSGFAGIADFPAKHGHLSVSVFDCFERPAPHVEVDATGTDSSTTRAYVAGSLPSKTATETDATGLVSFINVPAGITTVTIRPKALKVVTAKRTVFIRAGAITLLILGPTP